MDEPSIELVTGIVGGVIVGAAFTACRAGLLAIGEARLHAMAEEGGPVAAVAARVIAHEVEARARLFVGSVIATALAIACAAYLSMQQGGWPWPVVGVAAAALVYALTTEVATTIVQQRSPRAPLLLLRWIRPLDLVLAPLAAPLVWAGCFTKRVLPMKHDHGTDAERLAARIVEHVIDEGEEEGAIGEDQANLLRSVLEFRDTVTREVMVPRTKVAALAIDAPLAEVVATVVASGHSRYPVYRERIDQIEGVLYAKDLFRVLESDGGLENVVLETLVRKPAFFVPEERKVGVVLRDMQARGIHLAVVVDEFGGTSGIVTLEDILEEIVGEIRDEHDAEDARVKEVEPGRYVVDAGMSVYDLEERLGHQLGSGSEDFDSLGGMVIKIAGRVPDPGESVVANGFEMLVLDADDRRITRLELVRRAEPDEAGRAASRSVS